MQNITFTIDKYFMPVIKEIRTDPKQITIPEMLKLELDNTRNYYEITPRRIITNNILGQRSLKINTSENPTLNININPRKSLEYNRPSSSNRLNRNLSFKTIDTSQEVIDNFRGLIFSCCMRRRRFLHTHEIVGPIYI